MLMVSKITPRQVAAQLTRGEPVSFVDARSDAPAGRVPNAVSVRLASLVRDATRVARDRPVVVYGANDGDPEAMRVADQLRALGFPKVRILSGGFAAWQAFHGPIQTKDVTAEG